MKITKLVKHRLLGHAEIMACTDPPCGAINVDGTCGSSGDSNCMGIVAIDGDCGNTGDASCSGIWVQDSCNILTGVDAVGCSGVGKTDVNIAC